MPRRAHNANTPACPECGECRSHTTDSHGTGDFHGLTARRRRRQCSACGHRFTTYEISEDDVLDLRERLAAEFVALIRDTALKHGFERRTKE